MKNYLYSLILLIAICGSGCLGKPKNDVIPQTVPSGTFKGEFRLLHRKAGAAKFDTTKANITLTMTTTPSYIYSLTGDTATVHAGSHGSFLINSQYMIFTDETFPKTGTPTKTHLNGGYLYYYDGSVFQMLAYSVDTLSLQYDLKKQTSN